MILTLLDEIHLIYINDGIYYNMFSLFILKTIKQLLDAANMLLLSLVLMSSLLY
jgi:hypothetical protein